jgi:hypothetical protein
VGAGEPIPLPRELTFDAGVALLADGRTATRPISVPSTAENRALAEEALRTAASGELRPLVGRRLPLPEKGPGASRALSLPLAGRNP